MFVYSVPVMLIHWFTGTGIHGSTLVGTFKPYTSI